jgi:thioester reductase-like protein
MSGGHGDQDLERRLRDALRAARTRLAACEAAGEPVAVVGTGCRFPGGANDPRAFWERLRDGFDAVGPVPAERWDVDRFYDADRTAAGKTYVRDGSFLDRVDGFDAKFFGIAPREAVGMDPQQRLLLEVAWEALENAGQACDQLRGSATGVFAGVGFDDYAQFGLNSGDPTRIDAHNGLGNAKSVAVGRVAYVLGLQGPVMQLDTACSSSLLAVHLACQSLSNGECDLALAGGVSLILRPEIFVAFSRLGALSADGRCRTFDAAADGYGRGEGCGLVVLKRLSDAHRDGDNVLAVIRGSAVNHDGRSNGLSAPHGGAQEAVIRRALARAGVDGSQVGYVEAHGTGTRLGDPIEVRALLAALRPEGASDLPLHIGSVKTNIGHLESAAGIAGLIKLVLALRHRQIPPHPHFERPNPHIPWADGVLCVPTTLTEWPAPANGGVRVGGTSSFGMSGTNVHVTVAEAPPTPPRRREPGPQVLTLSARSRAALRELARRYHDYLETEHPASFDDVCFTACTGRAHWPHRLAVAASGAAEARLLLGEYLTGDRDRDVLGSGGPDASAYVRGDDLRERFEQSGGQRVALPTYPFEQDRYWPVEVEGEPPARDVDAGLVEYVRATAAAVLGLPVAEVNGQELHDLGFDSMMVVEMIETLHSDLKVELAPSAFEAQPTVASLVAAIESTRSGETVPTPVLDLHAKVVLDPAIRPSGTSLTRTEEPAHTLLTGATGFLGGAVLAELLRETGTTIHCLVRAPDAASARTRLRRSLEARGLWREVDAPRIVVVEGDLAKPHLGLTPERFAALAREVRAIYHCGAALSYVDGYERLAPVNVGGTAEVLRLACAGGATPVHHVSTIAVFEASPYRGRRVTERDAPDDCEGIHLGYSKTKWVAERLVREAGKRGLPVTIYRPPLISGDSHTGEWPTDDFLVRLVRGCRRMGCVPSDLDLLLDVAPVDYVSRAIVHLSRKDGSTGRAFHLSNPSPIHWSTFVDLMAAWSPLEELPFAEWVARLRQQTDNELLPLMSVFTTGPNDEASYVELRQRPTQPRTDCHETLRALADSSITCPALDHGLFARYRRVLGPRESP